MNSLERTLAHEPVASSVPSIRSRWSGIAELARERAWAIAVWSAMTCWTIVLFVTVRDRYLEFRLGRYDLGNMVQAVWSTTQGRPLEWTNGATGEQVSRLGSHVDPILALLAPLWAVAPTPLTLVAAQIAAVALGALPVLWLGRRHLGSERAAALLALVYLAYPWIAWAAVDVFHPVVLAIPLFLYCIWFLDTDRLVAFSACAVLVLMTGELMGIPLAALGLWYALARGRRRAGSTIAALGVGWTAIAVFLVVPASSGGSSVYYGAFDHVGGSPSGVAKTVFTDPGNVFAAVTNGSDGLYLLVLAVPLGGAFLLAPGLSAAALPILGVNVMSSMTAPTYPYLHYVSGIVPFLVAATVVGIGRLAPRARLRAVVVVLFLTVTTTLAAGPWPGGIGWTPSWYWGGEVSDERVETLERALVLVPDDASIAATNRVGSHLAARRYLYSLPRIGRAEWIVLDADDVWIPQPIGGDADPKVVRTFRERIERSPEWVKVFEEQSILVFRKVGA